MREIYRVGLVGCGSIAENAHLPILTAMDNVELLGVCTKHLSNAKDAARKYNIKHAVEDVGQLIELGIDSAFVLSPKENHHEHVVQLLNAGIDVFCEKPMGCSLQEMRDQVEVAERTGKGLMIGFNRRYAPVYQKAKHEFATKSPDVIIAQKNRPASEYRATLENAIHMVDLLRFFCGECVEIEAYSQFTDPYYETLTTAQMKFENGTIGMLVADRASGQWMETFEIHGQNKSVLVDCPDSITVVKDGISHTTNMTPLAMGWSQVQDIMGFRGEVEHFFECLGKGTQFLTNARDSYNTHELMHRILKAAGLPDLENS